MTIPHEPHGYRLGRKWLAARERERVEASPCDKPPPGWRCTRGLGHEGPCAAWPVDEREETE